MHLWGVNMARNKILIGIILLIIGITTIFLPSFMPWLNSLVIAALGFAFFLLYKTKHKLWALVLAVVFLFISCDDLVRMVPFLPDDFAKNITQGFRLLIPGGAMLIYYFDKKSNFLLLPSMLLIWLGFSIFGMCLPFLKLSPLLYIAGAFMCCALISKHGAKTYRNIGLICLLLGCIMNVRHMVNFGNHQNMIVSLIIIVLAIIMIVRAVKNRIHIGRR